MLGIVVTLLIVCLVALVVGAVTVGLFWLALVAIAGILGTGAVGVSLLGLRAEDGAPPAGRRAGLTVITPPQPASDGHAVHDGGEIGKAA
jgi:hypothetical protein